MKKRFHTRFGSLGSLLSTTVLLVACTPPGPTPEEARELAREAWIYGFPMVMNYKTMVEYAVDTGSPEYKGPFNTMPCEARVFTPEDRAVVTPNSDTPYCMAWADLRTEPIVLTVPPMDEGRYYSVQLIDLFTHNFAYVGSLTTGSEAGRYLLAGPGWDGDAPSGVDDVIPVETDFFFAIIRTQLFGPDDIDAVRNLQQGYALQPLSEFLGTASPEPAPGLDFPPWREGVQFNVGALEYVDFVLDLVETPDEDAPLLGRLSAIGLGTPERFDLGAFPADVREALELGVQDGLAELEAFIVEHSSDPLVSARIFGTRDFLSRSAVEHFGLERPYMLRSAGAQAGLYGNSGFEALYPTYFVDSEGRPLDGSANTYEMRFEAGALPPVEAFWSLTMYDGRTQLLIENPINRYLLNSTMMNDFRLESDGSLVLYVQRDAPGGERNANWLPAPDGPFYTVLRLYGPAESALDGSWRAPALIATGQVAR